MDTTGILDEALERLHRAGPERLGRLTNHAPMAAEALVRHGRAASVHRWLDAYAPELEALPDPFAPVTHVDWQEALGDPRRAADWIAFFDRELAARPWREVLAHWWPRLLPGLYGGSTHPVIRVGHAVRTLLDAGSEGDGGNGEDPGPRRTELAHGLGYWAARHHPVTGLTATTGPTDPADPTRPTTPAASDAASDATARPLRGSSAAAALDAVRPIDAQDGNFPTRLARVTGLPHWPAEPPAPEAARERLRELVRAATHRYLTHGHGEETMLVHAATAPNAVLRTLPALPPALWAPSLHAAWTASAAVTAMYAPRTSRISRTSCTPLTPTTTLVPDSPTPAEVFERALAHGDEHVIKFTDTALDTADARSLRAALHAVHLTQT
ncbi:questin oxidase family protein [Streptomyces sp. NPDC097619]|uniref:questin oxidase family protein n=1 Tax=Streptomyces sp. NPDC097619 TaxID=3157228 RepID=UPI0033318386